MTTSTTNDETDVEPDVEGEADESAAASGEGAEADTEASDAPAELDDAGEEPAETTRGAGATVAAGAAAVVSAGLGFASLTGTWLGAQMSQRQELIGQINSSGGQLASPEEQLAAIHGTPLHTTALFNGVFALVAIIAAVLALLLPALAGKRGTSPVWVRAVAFGGLALGVVGLVIAGVIWFDIFTNLPTVPEAPATPAAPTP